MIFLKTDRNDGVSLAVYVQPRASSNQICGIHGEALRVRITAPPVDDKANAVLVRFFSKLFNMSKSSIRIAQGKQSRNKIIALHGIERDAIAKILHEFVDG